MFNKFLKNRGAAGLDEQVEPAKPRAFDSRRGQTANGETHLERESRSVALPKPPHGGALEFPALNTDGGVSTGDSQKNEVRSKNVAPSDQDAGSSKALELEPLDFSFDDGRSGGRSSKDVVVDEVSDLEHEAIELIKQAGDLSSGEFLLATTLSYDEDQQKGFWYLLHDVYLQQGKRKEAEDIEKRYQKHFGTSWEGCVFHDAAAEEEVCFEIANSTSEIELQHVLSFSRGLRFPPIVIDLNGLTDFSIAGLASLHQAIRNFRRNGFSLQLVGYDRVKAMLQAIADAKQEGDEDKWLLLLEIYHYEGEHDAFEELSLEYALFFEISAPSWEPDRLVGMAKPPKLSSMRSERVVYCPSAAEASEVKELLRGLLSVPVGAKHIILDMRNVRYIDAEGVDEFCKVIGLLSKTRKIEVINLLPLCSRLLSRVPKTVSMSLSYPLK